MTKIKLLLKIKKGRESIPPPAFSVREFSSPAKAIYASLDVNAKTIF